MDRSKRQELRARVVVIAIAGLIAGISPVDRVLAANPVEVGFSYTGAEETFVVPSGVTWIHVVLVGGRGGDAGPGGFGHVVTGDLDVAAGTTLHIEVGGNGAGSIGLQAAAGGFNGGGTGETGTENAGAGGGGASDIRLSSRATPGTLESRLLVAAGGGGRGGGSPVGGAGGSGGSSGSDGSGPGLAGFGGGAGTSFAGGIGGTGGGGAGSGGALGVGGTGGAQPTGAGGNGGGGGGGGYYGGGGGGAGSGATGGGGGGGSSFTGAARNAFLAVDATGVPSISITYEVGSDPTPAPDSGVVDAEVTVPTSAACIELSTTTISFGTQRFGGQDLPATPEIIVTNCSGSDESLLARGSDATGSGATWQLVDGAGTCSAGTLATDDFHLKLQRADTAALTVLSTNNKTIRPLAAGEDGTLDALLDMPCPGSSGAGQTMGMQIVFVVVEQ